MVTFEVVLIVLFIMEFSVIYGDKSSRYRSVDCQVDKG